MQYSDLPKCPIEVTVRMIDSKWKILILRELIEGTQRFCQLKKNLKGITSKVLSAKLKEMENIGLLTRKTIDNNNLKVEYTLTDIGYSLAPVINEMRNWGKDYKKYVKLLEKMRYN